MKNPFEYQAPTSESIVVIQNFRETCSNLHNLILGLPESRERSLAITKLEETSMWLNKAIVFHQKEVVTPEVPTSN